MKAAKKPSASGFWNSRQPRSFIAEVADGRWPWQIPEYIEPWRSMMDVMMENHHEDGSVVWFVCLWAFVDLFQNYGASLKKRWGPDWSVLPAQELRDDHLSFVFLKFLKEVVAVDRQRAFREFRRVAKEGLRYKRPGGEVTHGVLLYHEQVIGIGHRLGGLELRDGARLLKAVCKRSQEKIDEYRKRFVTGTEEKKIDPDVANSIFDSIVRGAGHTTCKANNTIAATIAYQLAYLKANHAEAFTAADAEGTYAAFDEALLADLKAHHPEAMAATDAA